MPTFVPIKQRVTSTQTQILTHEETSSTHQLATTYGIGMVWAAPVLFCWQGMFYLIAKLSADAITDEIRTELCIVGGVLIVASGLSILKIKDCKSINMLPSFLIIVLFFVAKRLFAL